MKSKLVKYPFNEKKWRWDTWKLGRKFLYSWDKSAEAKYKEINPYIEVEDFVYDKSKQYAGIDLSKNTSYAATSQEEMPLYTATTTITEQDENISNVISNDISGVYWMKPDDVLDKKGAREAGKGSVYLLKKNITDDLVDTYYTIIDYDTTIYPIERSQRDSSNNTIHYYNSSLLYYTGSWKKTGETKQIGLADGYRTANIYSFTFDFWFDEEDIPEGTEYKTTDWLDIKDVDTTFYITVNNKRYFPNGAKKDLSSYDSDDMKYLCVYLAMSSYQTQNYVSGMPGFWPSLGIDYNEFNINIHRPAAIKYWTKNNYPKLSWKMMGGFVIDANDYIKLKEKIVKPNVSDFYKSDSSTRLFYINKDNLYGLTTSDLEYICSNKKDTAYIINLFSRLGKLNPITKYILKDADIGTTIYGSSIDDYAIEFYQKGKITFNYTYIGPGYYIDKETWSSSVDIKGVYVDKATYTNHISFDQDFYDSIVWNAITGSFDLDKRGKTGPGGTSVAKSGKGYSLCFYCNDAKNVAYNKKICPVAHYYGGHSYNKAYINTTYSDYWQFQTPGLGYQTGTGEQLVEKSGNNYYGSNNNHTFKIQNPDLTYVDVIDYDGDACYYLTLDENYVDHDEVIKLESRIYENKSESLNTKYIVDIDDWKSIDNDLTHYYWLTHSEIQNAQYLLKPNALLIADKSAETVDITTNTVDEYYLGDPPKDTTTPFVRKALQFNVPSNYSSEPMTRDTLTIKWKSQEALNDFILSTLIQGENFYYGTDKTPITGDVEFGWARGVQINDYMATDLPDETMNTFGWYVHATDIGYNSDIDNGYVGYNTAIFDSLYLPHNTIYPFTFTPTTTTDININDYNNDTDYNYTGTNFYKLTVGTNYTFASQEDLDNFKKYLAQFNQGEIQTQFWGSVDLFDNLFEIEQETYYEIDNVWLTYNVYTVSEWLSGYHFEGKYWNSIFSPYAYVSNITQADKDRKMVFKFGYVPEGKYANLFKIYKNAKVEVKDSNGVSYITNDTTIDDIKTMFHNFCGGLWEFDDNIVISNNRHAYPDNGSQNRYSYVLRPQDTKFIEYFREQITQTNCELFSDRYTYTYDTTDFCDRSYEGTICGTSSSTGEDTIPDGTWREYIGLYLGTSIPFLSITETDISPKEILSQPSYNKEVNTSETLKYGTVSSASITFTVNKSIALAKEYLNNYLILYYDFENNDNYKRMGWFYVDGVEAIDENTSRITAHDEVYKLNKYVDDFMNSLVGTSTLDATYRGLLTYCGCQYDEKYPKINNGDFVLYNSYNTAKTTGVQVIHYIAQISPGFIEANTEGDIVLSRYTDVDYTLTLSDYTDLEYTPFTSDLLDKVKILINNTVKGEDSGTGINAYYIDNSPLIPSINSTSTLNDLAQSILTKYKEVPEYRPATITMLVLPNTSTGDTLKIGDCISIITKSGETYKVIVMTMNVEASGITITSIGTEAYPVEGNEITSQFINLVNQLDNLDNTTSDIKIDLQATQNMLSTKIENVEADLSKDIKANAANISNIQTEQTTQSTNISNLQTDVSNLQSTTSGYGVSVADNLASIMLNGTTGNIATKAYVDAQLSSNVEIRKITVRLTSSGSYTNHMYIGNISHTDGVIVSLFDSGYDILVLSNSKLYRLDTWSEFTNYDIQW